MVEGRRRGVREKGVLRSNECAGEAGERKLGGPLGWVATSMNCLERHAKEWGLTSRHQEEILSGSMQFVEQYHRTLVSANSLHGRELNTGEKRLLGIGAPGDAY